MEFFELSVLVATIASGIRLSTPYLLAGLGETIGQRSGVLNLGVDGVMMLSAWFAYWTVLEHNNIWLGMLVGLVVGLVMGLIYAFITVTLGAAQGISGIGIFLFGLGFSDLMFQTKVGTPRPLRTTLDEIDIPLLADIPKVGQALFQHHILTYAAFALVPAVAWFLRKTTLGLNIRAVGENPEAADSLGVSVVRTRYIAILIGNTFAGLAGAALVLRGGIFQPNLTQGLGLIAVALVYFGAWRPTGVMAGAILYGLVQASVLKLKVLQVIPRSASDIASMAPAIITIVALVIIAGRVKAPAALTKPFSRH